MYAWLLMHSSRPYPWSKYSIRTSAFTIYNCLLLHSCLFHYIHSWYLFFFLFILLLPTYFLFFRWLSTCYFFTLALIFLTFRYNLLPFLLFLFILFIDSFQQLIGSFFSSLIVPLTIWLMQTKLQTYYFYFISATFSFFSFSLFVLILWSFIHYIQYYALGV